MKKLFYNYEPLCDLFIIPESSENVTLYGLRDGWSNQIYDMLPCECYRREFDIMNGVHSVSYEINGKNHQRESFISFPDKVFAIRCEGSPISAIIESGMYLEKLRKRRFTRKTRLKQGGYPRAKKHVIKR